MSRFQVRVTAALRLQGACLIAVFVFVTLGFSDKGAALVATFSSLVPRCTHEFVARSSNLKFKWLIS